VSAISLPPTSPDVVRRRAGRARYSGEWKQSVLSVFQPLLAPNRYKGAYGGRGGAKSHFFAELLLHRCVVQPTRAVCVREIQRSLEQSVKRLLEDKIVSLGLSERFRVMATHIETPHDGIIIFQGMQDHTAESLKSLEGYDVAWVEEAQMLSQRSLNLLRPTIRKEGSEIWFSWNPMEVTDPVDVFLRGSSPPPSTAVVETSYEDNPHLPQVLRDEIEWDKARDLEKYLHIWKGRYRKFSEARVFKNWRVEEFESPREADFYLGSDWGFSIDPSVLTRCFFLDARTLCVDHEAYEVGCEIEDTPDLFDGLLCAGLCPPKRSDCRRPEHGWARPWVVTADNARPETISHMQRHGYKKMTASIKGPNSVEEGISFLQSYDIIVHPRCRHTIDELTYYSYRVDPLTDVVLPILADKKNHVIDSLRYAVERKRRAKRRGLLV